MGRRYELSIWNSWFMTISTVHYICHHRNSSFSRTHYFFQISIESGVTVCTLREVGLSVNKYNFSKLRYTSCKIKVHPIPRGLVWFHICVQEFKCKYIKLIRSPLDHWANTQSMSSRVNKVCAYV